MAYKNKKPDIVVIGARFIMLFLAVGMLYFPYQAGKKYFKKYPTQAAKIKGTLLATLYSLLGFLIDILLFNIVLTSFKNPPPKGSIGEHLLDPLGLSIFFGLFFIGSMVGYIGKKYDTPTK